MSCIYCCLFEVIVLTIYPLSQTYQSYQLEEKQKLWITYWILMSSIYLLEQITFGVLLSIPGYIFIKAVYAVWLYHSKTQGALIVGSLLKPVFSKLKAIVEPHQSTLEIIEKAK